MGISPGPCKSVREGGARLGCRASQGSRCSTCGLQECCFNGDYFGLETPAHAASPYFFVQLCLILLTFGISWATGMCIARDAVSLLLFYIPLCGQSAYDSIAG